MMFYKWVQCFIVAPIVCVGSVFSPRVFPILCFLLAWKHLDGEERVVCFTLIVFLMYYEC